MGRPRQSTSDCKVISIQHAKDCDTEGRSYNLNILHTSTDTSSSCCKDKTSASSAPSDMAFNLHASLPYDLSVATIEQLPLPDVLQRQRQHV